MDYCIDSPIVNNDMLKYIKTFIDNDTCLIKERMIIFIIIMYEV